MLNKSISILVLIMAAFITSGLGFQAHSGEANVIKASAKQQKDNSWRFTVTVRHKDTGWSHYADRWEVLSLDRKILATRVLAHPHENEQPFTRSLSGVVIPVGTKRVIVRAHDKVHEYGGKEVEVDLKSDTIDPSS